MPRLPALLRRLAAMSSRFISLSLTCGRSLTWRAVITIFLVNVWANWITASPRWGTRWCCVSVMRWQSCRISVQAQSHPYPHASGNLEPLDL